MMAIEVVSLVWGASVTASLIHRDGPYGELQSDDDPPGALGKGHTSTILGRIILRDIALRC
jgi:hypothetical protein